MALKYDLNGIFADLEEQVKKKQKQYEEIDETKENESIESPEDAPQTQEVAPATSKTSEDIHGRDEASKEIKNSQNSVVDGENSNKENKNMMEEDSRKFGEFISSYFAWKTLDEQKKISEKLADITEDKKE